MVERQRVKKDGSPDGWFIMTETKVTVETPGGRRKCDAGTMFLVLPFSTKLPAGSRVEGQDAGYGDVVIHWAGSAEDVLTTENEPSLRRKIAKAEGRRWWGRSAIIGATGGSALKLLENLPNWLAGIL